MVRILNETELAIVRDTTAPAETDIISSIRQGIAEANNMLKTAQDTMKQAAQLKQNVNSVMGSDVKKSTENAPEVIVVQSDPQLPPTPAPVAPSQAAVQFKAFIDQYGDKQVGFLLDMIKPLTVNELLALLKGGNNAN